MTPALRRFWQTVDIRPGPDGFAILLDDKPVRSPARRALRLPNPALAEAVAAEWRAVEAEIRPAAMPLTRAANTVLDRIAPQHAHVVGTVAAYGATDLICYRAETPDTLVRRQAEAWDPWLDWSRAALNAPLITIAGVMHHPQPEASLARLRARVAAQSPWELSGLHDLVVLSGSLVLGLAVQHGALAPGAAWDLSRIDHAFQAEQWGKDAEAQALAAARRAEFLQAATWLDLLSQ